MERQILGDYEIIKEMGQGPLGKVFLAEHRFIKKRFVLKLLPNALNSDVGFCDRFKSNIQHISMLTHPNIVQVHNVSEVDGQYFLVTDAILSSGRSLNLSTYLQVSNHTFSEKEIISILTKIAQAINYAHSKGVIHGGIKPNNILLQEQNGSIDVFLSDFGLAPILGEGYLLTQTYNHVAQSLSINFDKANLQKDQLPVLHYSFLQSFYFLSPEQKRGMVTSYASDVYAFGILAYYLITKEHPEGLFLMPSQINKEFMLNWDSLIFHCMQKDPERRPKDLNALLSQILSPNSQMETPVPVHHEPPVQSNPIPINKIADMNITSKREKMQTPQASYRQEPMEQPQEPTLVEPQAPVVDPLASLTSRLHPQPRHADQIKSSVSTMVKPAVDKKLQPVIAPQEVEKPIYEPDPSAVFQTETIVAPYKPKEVEEKKIEPLMTDMVVISGGEFSRGNNEGARDERPQHKIYLDSFAMDVHPVTNEQYARFLEMMGGEKDHNNNDIIRLRDSRIHKTDGKYVIESGYNKHPVVGVTWYGAVAYAKWVGKRLPTEAEWEIVARAMQEDVIYPTGDEIDKDHANYFSSDTSKVMTFPPNDLGIHDLSGNVYEWCDDWYDYNYYEFSNQEPENPKGPHQGVYRVLRGGCWKSLKDDLRCSHRHRNNPGTSNRTYGFRCASNVS